MQTTLIQVKKSTAARLKKLKRYSRQTYDEIINALIDNPDDLTVEDIEAIKKGLADIKAGRVYTQEQVAKELGIKL